MTKKLLLSFLFLGLMITQAPAVERMVVGDMFVNTG